jgi:molybdopterin molybdotransferase
MVTFLMLARPALLRMQGATQTGLPSILGTLREPLQNRGDRRHFVRVRLDETGHVSPTGVQASHMLGSLARAIGLVDVPPRADLQAGHPVRVMLIDG